MTRYHTAQHTLNDLLQGAIRPLDWYINEGLLVRREHPTRPYAILNYTDRCTYDQHWDLVTRQCRGLIYRTDNGEIIGRPFEKFFNFGEPAAENIDLDLEGAIYDKLDGSLGILYPVDDYKTQWAIATRGSFTSDQALEGTKMLQRYCESWLPREGWTYLFEVIYPDNRIVLDYGSRRELVLLDILDIETGTRMYDRDWPGPRAEVLAVDVSLRDAIKFEDRENREGIVWVQYGPRGVRFKLKQEDYVQKHRIIFGLSARTVWEVLSSGATDEEVIDFIAGIPEELHGWVEDQIDDLSRAFAFHYGSAYALYNEVVAALGSENFTRKEFAEEAKHQAEARGGQEYFLMTFLILDGNDNKLREWCWKKIYPSADRPRGSEKEE